MLAGIKLTPKVGRLELLNITSLAIMSKQDRLLKLFFYIPEIIRNTNNTILDIEDILRKVLANECVDNKITFNEEDKLNLYKKGEIKAQETKTKITTIKTITNKLQNISSTFQRLLI